MNINWSANGYNPCKYIHTHTIINRHILIDCIQRVLAHTIISSHHWMCATKFKMLFLLHLSINVAPVLCSIDLEGYKCGVQEQIPHILDPANPFNNLHKSGIVDYTPVWLSWGYICTRRWELVWICTTHWYLHSVLNYLKVSTIIYKTDWQ